MPGVFGAFYRKKKRSEERIQKFSSCMLDILKHSRTYNISKVNLEGFFCGKVGFSAYKRMLDPVWSQDKKILLMLDGAIFSYKDKYGNHEISDSNEIFRKLLKEFAEEGFIDTRNLNGEFNLVVYDREKRRLLIANDRWGFRELYYYKNDEVLIFAPEVKAILCWPGFEITVDESSLIDFLHCGYILNDRTFFKDVFLIPPGCTLIVDEGSEQIFHQRIRYQVATDNRNYRDQIEELYTALEKSVERRVREQENICVSLSGGLDSRLILGTAVKHRRSMSVITLGGKRCREYRIARKVVSRLGLESHVTVEPTWKHLIKYAEPMVWLTDGMVSLGFLSTSFGSQFHFVSENDLLIGGFGGDHTIGGSRITKRLLGESADSEYLRELALRRTRAVGDITPYASELFEEKFREKFMYACEKSVVDELERAARYTDNLAFQQEIFLFFTRYRRLLNQARGLVGHATIEEFYPYFDQEFIDVLYSLPPDLRYKSKLLIDLYKSFLPHLAEIEWLKTGVSLYDKESTWSKRKKRLMHGLRWYTKRATFGKVNIKDRSNYAEHDIWYRTSKQFRQFVNGILLDERTLERGILKKEGIIKLIRKMKRGFDLFGILDRLVIVELVYRKFIDINPITNHHNSFLDSLGDEKIK